jgi:GntR family transcriptional regulator, transcriptional repressor for pyruvate dehydrogenase complex
MRAGELDPGQRLPSETELARHFAVSRTTVREALRLLTAHQLIRTSKGPTGGSVVTLPTADNISDYLGSTMYLLGRADHVSLEEFLQAREVLEVPAARMAAERHAQVDLERIRRSLQIAPLQKAPDDAARRQGFVNHTTFHALVVEASGNTLLCIAAHPVFAVLQRALAESNPGKRFDRVVDEQHLEIVEAIEDADADLAARLMKEHLDFLRPYHDRAWREGRVSQST